MENLLQRNAFMESVVTQLSNYNDKLSKVGDAYVFLSILSDDSIRSDVNGRVFGEDNRITETFMQTIGDKDSPQALKKALLVCAANMLTEYDDKFARVLSLGIGTFVERVFGHIGCDCEKCKAQNQEEQS